MEYITLYICGILFCFVFAGDVEYLKRIAKENYHFSSFSNASNSMGVSAAGLGGLSSSLIEKRSSSLKDSDLDGYWSSMNGNQMEVILAVVGAVRSGEERKRHDDKGKGSEGKEGELTKSWWRSSWRGSSPLGGEERKSESEAKNSLYSDKNSNSREGSSAVSGTNSSAASGISNPMAPQLAHFNSVDFVEGSSSLTESLQSIGCLYEVSDDQIIIEMRPSANFSSSKNP
jgi:hypothetical protein